jgi:hypothetical protein
MFGRGESRARGYASIDGEDLEALAERLGLQSEAETVAQVSAGMTGRGTPPRGGAPGDDPRGQRWRLEVPFLGTTPWRRWAQGHMTA